MITNAKKRITFFINPFIAKQAKAQAVVEDLTLINFTAKNSNQLLPKEKVIRKNEVKGKNKG